MNEFNLLISAVIALGLGVFYFRQKAKSAEALNENIETKEKVLELEKTVKTEEAKNIVEEEKREELKKDLEEKKNEDLSNKDLVDFFTRTLNDK